VAIRNDKNKGKSAFLTIERGGFCLDVFKNIFKTGIATGKLTNKTKFGT